jgi:hypothetical protein
MEGIADPMLAAQVGNLGAVLTLFQCANNLLIAETNALHFLVLSIASTNS